MKNFWTQLTPPILALSPMAGVTDAAFRIMCKRFGADIIYTEFASANGLVHGNKATRDMIAFTKEERPVVCQIFGQDPGMMAQAAVILEQLGFDGVDLNFGCPAYKVVKHGGGVCLMRNPKQIAEIVHAVCESVKIPVSIKIRGSIKSEDKKHTFYAKDIIEVIQGLPVAAVMVHGRSYEKPFDGEPNTETIHEVVKNFSGIVLANGGVYTPEDAKKLLDATGAHGVGVARGAWGKPWIFQQIKSYLNKGTFEEPSNTVLKSNMLMHAELAMKSKGNHGLIEMRKHLSWYVKGLPRAKELRQALVRVATLSEIQAVVEMI